MLLAVRFWLTSPIKPRLMRAAGTAWDSTSTPSPDSHIKVPLPRLRLRSLTHCPLAGVGGHSSHWRCPSSSAGGRVCVDLFEGRWATVVEIKKAHILGPRNCTSRNLSYM